jgi:AcrR family transcriptional regulator
MPRRSQAEARETRSAIVERAMDVASVEGLEGLTIGRLAADLEMSKAGVLGHFGTKEMLQLSAVEAAADLFRREVWMPASRERPGLQRLLAVCDAWVAHIAGNAFAGGCFFTAASTEFDGRDGRVRQAIADMLAGWYGTLRREVELAVEAGELPAETDPAQVGFELRGIAMGLNQELQLHGDRTAPDRARRAIRRVLGVQAPAPKKRRRASSAR